MHGASFLMHKVYTDEVTLKLVGAACEVLGLDLDTCLEAFGEHFLYFCQQHGYDHILRVLGSNMADFLTNLDNLHDHLASTYPGMRAPSFRVTPGPNGQILLHYYSDRKGLHPIVLGIVKVVGKQFFDTEVSANISVVSEFGDRAHVTLEITELNKEGKSSLLPSNVLETLSNRPEDLPIGVKTMCAAFPFHVVFGKDFGVVQAGKGLLRLTGHLWKQSKAQGRRLKFDDLFEISRPVIDCTFESIRSYCNQVFVVQTREGVLQYPREEEEAGSDQGRPLLRLKGQMVSVEETRSILFLCSPRVKDIDDMRRIGLFFSDLAIHDPARELFLRSHHHRGERELIEKLDEATNRLKMLQSKLDEDKKKTEELLHSILPSKVAKRLCQNLPVEAEKFETVSCLFSDIVGFTSMSGSCPPMEIVRLLNHLYLQFDNLSGLHGVYKVETIGDAYVVVAGVPEPVEDHADRLIAMGLDMITATRGVLSPVNGEPIQARTRIGHTMRIGVHTGYATAGVVGLTMPRYCLFGNTVTLANKTESLSKPSRVNVTEVARRHLTKQDYVFEENLDVGDFPLKCYLVDLASQKGAAGDDAATLVESTGAAEDSMLLSPSSSPVRRTSSVPSPSFEADEIGMFIESRFTNKSTRLSDQQQPPIRGDGAESPLFAPRQKATGSAPHGITYVHRDSGTTRQASGVAVQDNPSPNGADSLGQPCHDQESVKSGNRSFMGLRWKQPSKVKGQDPMKPNSCPAPPVAADDSEETSGDQSRFLQESPEPKPGRLQCPFFRFRARTTGLEDVQGTSKPASLVSNPGSTQDTPRRAEGRKKDKFWSRVIFPS
ncbi:unnamed protein product [Ixodes hexagonus]